MVAPLLVLQPAELIIANRTAERARAFAADFTDLGAIRGCGFETSAEEVFDVVINATSASLSGDVPSIPPIVLRARHGVLRPGLRPKPTPFLHVGAREKRAGPPQGWGMLVEQAAESFHLWRGIRPRPRRSLKQRIGLVSA